MRDRPPLSPEVRALLDRERAVPPIPAAQRARALARARAALAAPAAAAPAPPVTASRTRWVVAAAAGLMASAAIGAAAYQIRARLAHTPSAPPAGAIVRAPALIPAAHPEPAVLGPESGPELAPEPTPAIAERALSPADVARAELRLLRLARAAVARGDFEAALAPLAEHARRFKNGRLAEEREALRVKSLAGLGRTEEARRAAAAFRARFPRSVLLPAVSRMPASAP